MEVILYEDEAVSDLFPITMARPAYDVRTGGFTLFEAVKYVFPKATVLVHTRKLVEDIALASQFSASEKKTGGFLFLNARLTPSLFALEKLRALLNHGHEEYTLVAHDEVVGFFKLGVEGDEAEKGAGAAGGARHELPWKLFKNPEEVIIFNRDVLAENLTIFTKNMRAKKRGLYIGRGVKLPKQFSYDASAGPIVIGDHVKIDSFVVLKGPLMIGESSIIKEFSLIEGGTTIGPVCKIGGEVASSIFDGYSNKQHYGHVGDSYIGRWVNIGAGSAVSNLKNTYSNITVDGRDSGTQFLGTIIGDFSKVAINTSIFCGKIAGVAAHLYGLVAEDVPSFTSHVRPGVMYELPVSLAEKGQKAMAMRRGVQFTDLDTARLVHLFDKTADERSAKGVSKEKISFL